MEIDDPNYKTLFFLATFTDDNELLLMPIEELDEPPMAEVMVPHKVGEMTYAITFYITNKDNRELCFEEMLILDAFVKESFGGLLEMAK